MMVTSSNIKLTWYSPTEKTPEEYSPLVYVLLDGQEKEVDKEDWGDMEPFLARYHDGIFYECLDDGSDENCCYPAKEVAAWAEAPKSLSSDIMNMNKAVKYSLCKLEE